MFWTKKSKEKVDMIETSETRWCPFCECEDIYSGSWSPETCQNIECGAVYHFGAWYK